MENEFLVWVDLETTGLNPRADKVLEIAVVVTDFALNEYRRYHRLVSNAKPTNDVVMQMHAKSGLTQALNEVAKFPTLKEIDAELAELIFDDIAGTKPQFYFAGNSVHFDARFIEKNFPTFASKMSYRILDITSLKLFLRDTKGEEEYRKMLPEFKGTKHRAMDDIEDSIAFYRAAKVTKVKRKKFLGIF